MRKLLMIVVFVAVMPTGIAWAQWGSGYIYTNPLGNGWLTQGSGQGYRGPIRHRAPPAPSGPTIYHFPGSQSNGGYQIQWPGSSGFNPDLYLR